MLRWKVPTSRQKVPMLHWKVPTARRKLRCSVGRFQRNAGRFQQLVGSSDTPLEGSNVTSEGSSVPLEGSNGSSETPMLRWNVPRSRQKVPTGVAVESTKIPAMMSHVRRLPIVAVIGSSDPGPRQLRAVRVRRPADCGAGLPSPDRRRTGRDGGRLPRLRLRAGPRRLVPRHPPAIHQRRRGDEGEPNPWVEIPILTHLAGRLGPTATTAATRSTS